ncbi:MAG: antitoxin [Spirochaetes bacterium GWD1_27_9]|nr:MAG: antitoxin [Spirochaetes bacterium GWB1_27_13]OHD26373.1 MAG: antitoxin [Spirochaetes bacterium GWC1_27_15]OHD42113.1 MAG: antitoxin [Spirochaetes bacterium GWD1_27_9]
MANLQVKDIDSMLYISLKNLAKKEHRSVSQEVIKIIESYLNQPNNKNKNMTDEFLKLSGSWDDNRTSDEIINDIYSSRNTNQRFDNGIFD